MNYDYVYNFAYLGEWKAANPQLSKNKILKSIGSSDYECFNDWLAGKKPMPTGLLLKFCNTYGVSLSNFLRDKNATRSIIIPPPEVNDMIEPAGGWPEYGHKHGRQVVNPKANVHIDNVDPYNQQKSEVKDSPIPEDESMAITTLRLTMKHREDLIEERHKKEIANLQKEWALRELELRKEIEQEYKAERMKHLQIIADQTSQIADLTNKVNAYQSRPYHVVQQYEPEEEQTYGMVAEDLNKS